MAAEDLAMLYLKDFPSMALVSFRRRRNTLRLQGQGKYLGKK
jgi:hypothetical protein